MDLSNDAQLTLEMFYILASLAVPYGATSDLNRLLELDKK
jgi:hypothetical protein